MKVRPSVKRIGFSGSHPVLSALALLFCTCLRLNLGRAASAPSDDVTTTLSIPFSGTLSSDLEDISVSGVLHIVTEVTFAANTVFGRVHTNISSTTGVNRLGSGLSIDLMASFRYVRPHGEKTAGGIRRGLLPRDCPR